jgi:hypothetical protein
MTTDLSDPHRALARRHRCRDAHSANSALGHRNDPVWRVGVLRTVRYRRAAARAMVGAVGRFPSSSARTMRRYCHASAATPSTPSSRSAIASAPESRLKHPAHVPNTGRVRFQVSSELRRHLIGGRNRPGLQMPLRERCCVCRDRLVVHGPKSALNRDRAPWCSRRENPRNPGGAMATARTQHAPPVPHDLDRPESGMLLLGSCT